MNPAFVSIAIFVAGSIFALLGKALYSARKGGRDDQRLDEVEGLKSEIDELKDKNLQLETEMANIRGWLRGYYRDPINGKH